MICDGCPQIMSPCWALRWVGSIDDELYITIMSSTQKKAKRALSESDDDSVEQQRVNFPRFILIEAVDSSKPITKISPFVIEKQMKSILGTPKSVKSLRNGSLLVEITSKAQSQNLLSTNTFFGHSVKVSPHKSLNSSKGVIRCRELSSCSLDEIKEGLSSQGIIDVKRISIKRNNEIKTTNTYIITCDTPVIPSRIKVGYQIVTVDIYVPNPLRCFKCQKYGHHEDRCRNESVCSKCAETAPQHQENNCPNTNKCANCGADHISNSKDCVSWKKEKEIVKIKYSENVSFQDARKIYESRYKSENQPSYASVAKTASVECKTCKNLLTKLCKIFPDKKTEIMQLFPGSDSSSHLDQLTNQNIPQTPKPTSHLDQLTNQNTPQTPKPTADKQKQAKTNIHKNPTTRNTRNSNTQEKHIQPKTTSTSSKPTKEPTTQQTSTSTKKQSAVTSRQQKNKPMQSDKQSDKHTVSSPVSTSNRYSDLDTDDDNLEGEASDSDKSESMTWQDGEGGGSKNLQSLQDAT